MRSDHLRRHLKVHPVLKSNRNILKTPVSFEMQLKGFSRKICNIVNEGEIREVHLNKEHKEALYLYQKHHIFIRSIDENIVLRSWQEDLIKYVRPEERQVIWVQGTEGNEGKSLFQNYIQRQYGDQRVVKTQIRNKTANLLHILRKRELTTTDIFLFNGSRSKNCESVNYEILEAIKDGETVASKYDSDIIRFNTPNVVMVFANHYPDVKELSKDRWLICKIVDNKLIVTMRGPATAKL